MKIYKAIMVIGMGTVLASCGSDSEGDEQTSESSRLIRISAAVNSTKGNYTTENLDGFGITIINSESEDNTYTNVEVSGSNDDGWSTATTMYWRTNTDEVVIVAYAPYSEDASITNETTSYEISVTGEQTEDDKSIDFLVWKDESYVPKTDLVNGAVQIPFAHALSRIDLDITLMYEYNYYTLEDLGGEGTTIASAENPFDEVYISGTILSGTCDFSPETITATADEDEETANVYPYEIAGSFESTLDEDGNVQTDQLATAHYQCILMPQTSDEFAVYMTIGTKTFVWNSGGLTLEGGKIYTISLYIGDGVDEEVSVKAWETGEETTLSAEI